MGFVGADLVGVGENDVAPVDADVVEGAGEGAVGVVGALVRTTAEPGRHGGEAGVAEVHAGLHVAADPGIPKDILSAFTAVAVGVDFGETIATVIAVVPELGGDEIDRDDLAPPVGIRGAVGQGLWRVGMPAVDRLPFLQFGL